MIIISDIIINVNINNNNNNNNNKALAKAVDAGTGQSQPSGKPAQATCAASNHLCQPAPPQHASQHDKVGIKTS